MSDVMSQATRSVAILAGGQATRFGGRDKGTLLVHGRTIRDRQVAELSTLTDDILLVGGPRVPRWGPRAEAGTLQPSDLTHTTIDVAGVRAIADIVPGCGPLGGLHAALTEMRGDAVFLVAGDMPYVSAPFVAYLLSLASQVDIVVPQTERGYHPLCAVYTRACLAAVTARLGDRRLRMRELVDEMPARIVTAAEIDRFGDRHVLLANVNTPAEYAGLEALQGHKL
jgi:molybdopterin-guanine dinucleotide biosynthesis protein A